MNVQNGDFRLLKPPHPASLVLTDPPYNNGSDYGPVSDNLTENEYKSLIEDLSKWSIEITETNATLIIIHYPRFFYRKNNLIERHGWKLKQSVRWCYPSNIGQTKKGFTTSSRDIGIYTKGGPVFNAKSDPREYRNPNDRRVKKLIENGSPGPEQYDWQIVNLQKNVGRGYKGYSNQIPRLLLERLILYHTNPSDTVADPFAGTGSTLDAAESTGRLAWGAELNPRAPCFDNTTGGWIQ